MGNKDNLRKMSDEKLAVLGKAAASDAIHFLKCKRSQEDIEEAFATAREIKDVMDERKSQKRLR